MAEYKISQKNNVSKPGALKNFWTPQRQQQVLRKKTVVTTIILVGTVVVLGGILAAMKIRSNAPIYLHSTAPIVQGLQLKQSTAKHNIYAIDPSTFNSVTSAITNKNTTVLNSLYASQVHIIIFGTLTNEILDNSKVAAVIANSISDAQSPWNFHVPASELAGWQTGPDGQYFDGIDEVGISSNGIVISIGFNTDGQIDTVFVAPSDVLDATTSPTETNTNTPPNEETPLPITSVNAAD
jgi:hypothetical protein